MTNFKLISSIALLGIGAYLILVFIGNYSVVLAQTPTKIATKSASPTPTSVDSKVSELKERIATQVAKLNIMKKRGIVGQILDSSNNQLTLEDLKRNRRFVDVDELTKFTDLGEKPIGISDLKKGSLISVIGLYNTESRRLLARFIRVRRLPTRILGEVTDIDKKNFTLEILDPQEGETKIVEVETVTKTQEYTKQGELAKSGFSKIGVGEKVLVVGLPQKESTPSGTQKLTASRLLLFPELSPNLKPSPTASPTATPTPKASPPPKPTLKPTTPKSL